MIVVLALVWAVVLLPSLFRSKLATSPIDGVRNFERSMGILANTRSRNAERPGRWIMVPRSEVTQPIRRRSRVIRRRRQMFERLLVAAAVTFLAGFVPSLRWMWFVHLAVDGALGIYVTRLLRFKREEQERTEKVTDISATEEPPTERASSGF